MIVICTKCQAKFRVADEKIGPRGAKVRCSKCQTVFLVRPDEAAQPDAAAPRMSPPPLPPPLPSAPPADPFAAFQAAPAAPTDAFAQGAAADPFAPKGAEDPFAPPPPDPFAASPATADPFAPRSTDPFAAPPAASDPFAPGAPADAAPPDASAAATELGALLATLPQAEPAPAAAPAEEGGLALEERAPAPPKPASSAPFDIGADAGYEAFADAQAFDPGALDLGGPASDVPPLAAGPLDVVGPLEVAGSLEVAGPLDGGDPAAAPAAAPPRPAAARSGAALPIADADAHAKERIPGRGSRLRAVAVNAVALVALLAAAAAILALWRTEGPIDAAALRPSAVLSALRGGHAAVPFAAREVRSGLYERERAPPVLFVRGTVVSRAPAPVASVQVRVELVRDGAVLAAAESVAGGVPTPEELWSARDAGALAAVAAAAARRAPAEVRPGDAVPFLVSIADPPADLAGTSLRVEAAPAGSGPP